MDNPNLENEVENTENDIKENDNKKQNKKNDDSKKKLLKKDKEIEKLKEELSNQKDSYLRLMAEYDNYRRRTKEEKDSIYTDAYSDALKTLLPTADNLERALAYSTGDSEKVIEGVKMTYDKLKASLETLGIEEIECKVFDPNVHNAVMHIEDDSYGEGEIVEVFEKGYKRGDKVIRYAMVKVAN